LADPAQTQRVKINHHDGGRDVYFEDRNGTSGGHHPRLLQRQLESMTAARPFVAEETRSESDRSPVDPHGLAQSQ
jgi:hypothetical protein